MTTCCNLSVYPATAVLLDLGGSHPSCQPAGVSLLAATRRASQIVDHAVLVGDMQTAALITEAFARLALHSSARVGSDQASGRERSALLTAAVALSKAAYPAAWERQMTTKGATQVSIDLMGLSALSGDRDHSIMEDGLAEMLCEVSAQEGAA